MQQGRKESKALVSTLCMVLGSIATLGVLTAVTMGVLTAYVPQARAAEIHVDPSGVAPGGGTCYSKIQAAIKDARTGDIIIVWPGIYKEMIDFLGKRITVKSMDPNDPNIVAATIIDANQTGSAVTFNKREVEDSVLAGFTIQNGKAENGGGIYGNFASPVIKSCLIRGNLASSNGGGIYFTLASLPRIENCTITENTALGVGGGIYCTSPSCRPDIKNCTISHNSAFTSGGGVYCEGSSPILTDCIIRGNSASNNGGGVRCYSSSSPVLSNCTISRNLATNGGGVACSTGSSTTLTNCIISRNRSSSPGGGVYCSDNSSWSLTNCTISNNVASDGGGIYSEKSRPKQLKNCILWKDWPGEISGDAPAVTYSDIGNQDPLFVNSDADDYHLTSGSPCIDAGDPNSSLPGDIDGAPRPQDGNKDGISRGDMGAYEYTVVPPPSVGTIIVTTNNPAASFTLSGPATYTGSGTSWIKGDAIIGAYSIKFNAIDKFLTPPGSSQTLAKGATISFNGTYLIAIIPPSSVAKPEMSPQSCTFTDSIRVHITCATPGAAIHYTIDGSEPTESSPLYTDAAPLTLTATTTIKARGFKSDCTPSETASETYPYQGHREAECEEDDTGVLDIEGSRGRVGWEVRIPVRIQAAPAKVAAFGFTVTYDPAILEYSGPERGELTDSFDFVDVNPVGLDQLIVGGVASKSDIPEGASGYLVWLKFKVKGGLKDECYPLQIESLKDDIKGVSNTGGCFCIFPICNGDLNGDGAVTPADALIAFRCYLRSGPCTDCSDVNLDGEVTPGDALCLFKRYLGQASCLD